MATHVAARALCPRVAADPMTSATQVAGLGSPGFGEVRAELERNIAERGEIGDAARPGILHRVAVENPGRTSRAGQATVAVAQSRDLPTRIYFDGDPDILTSTSGNWPSRLMEPDEAIHLKNRHRFAIAYRVAGTAVGLALVVLAVATSSWANGWIIALFGFVTVGGALTYHLLTSMTLCPKCRADMTNFRISFEETKRKLFHCARCGVSAYLTEGFYWQRDVAG